MMGTISESLQAHPGIQPILNQLDYRVQCSSIAPALFSDGPDKVLPDTGQPPGHGLCADTAPGHHVQTADQADRELPHRGPFGQKLGAGAGQVAASQQGMTEVRHAMPQIKLPQPSQP